MKKLYSLLTLLCLGTGLFAQVLLDEQFNVVPPAGWTIDAQAAHWTASNTNLAGGTAKEVKFDWSPQFNGMSRLISDTIDLTGINAINISFRHMVDDYAGGYTIGVATRSGGGSWNTVWSINVANPIDAQPVDIDLANANCNQPDFQMCFYFNGNSYNINDWYIDNLKISVPPAHDIGVKQILGPVQLVGGTPYSAQAEVRNRGLNTESFNVIYQLFNTSNVMVYSDTQAVSSMPFFTVSTVTFDPFTLNADESYKEYVIAALVGDQRHENDTLTRVINTFTGERKEVILEIGTGTWCQYCPGAALGADDLVANGKDVGVIENHGPAGQDPFAIPASLARNAYYGVPGYPTAYFDGLTSFVGGNHTTSMYASYLPIYNAKKAVNCGFNIFVYGTQNLTTYSIHALVTRHATTFFGDLKLRIAITESEIAYSWQGQTKLDFVNRLMVPDENGTVVNLSSATSIDIPLTFNVQTTWPKANLELVAFLQNDATKEILQGFKVKLEDLSPVGINHLAGSTTSLSGNYPNPFNTNTTISFTLGKTEKALLEVYDLNGQKIKTMTNGIMSSGEHLLTWDGTDNGGHQVNPGIYYYTLKTSDYTSTKKMVLSR